MILFRKEGSRHLKKIILLSLMIFLMTSLSACRETIKVMTPPENSFVEEEIPVEMRALKNEKETNFTLWSWQISSPELAQEYTTLIKNSNFDGIDFCILWNDFEPEQNIFDWIYLDSILDVFIKNDMNLSLSIMFWTADLKWKDSLDFQETINGTTYIYDKKSGPSICLNSEKNLNILENTIQAFASHCNEKYKQYITRWHIRTSSYGGLEYTPITDLDYSKPAMEAFYNYLFEKYETVLQFNLNYELNIESWDELNSIDYLTLTDTCNYDWKMFKQQSIINIAKLSSDIFKIANDKIPVALQVGSFWDTMAAVFRGVFDPYIISEETNVDIIHIDDAPDWPHNFSIDMITSITNKMVAMEIDGAWKGEEAFNDYLMQASISGESGVKYLNTANWEKYQIEKYSQTYLSHYKDLFTAASPRSEAEQTEIILVNTMDFIMKKPPLDLYQLYKNAYKVMSGSENRKVRFLTDTQIIKNPSLLDSIEEIHLGLLDDINYMYDELGILLANSKCRIIDDKNGQPNFLNQYQKPLDIDVQEKLRERIKEG
ncbi:MAG: Beta-galactosidase [Clostridia bacterium]|nr:Beta-galactosidase [Clostridia bacterium]